MLFKGSFYVSTQKNMELMYEARLEITGRRGKLHPVQQRPSIHPEPVVIGDSPVDRGGANIYGTVLRDGGVLRMWYSPIPERYVGGDTFEVAYAESDDGIHWRRPALNKTETQGGNLVNLRLHCPSVFIDPDAAPEQRYRASGWRRGRERFHGPESGYFLACSGDGLDWQIDEQSQLAGSDVITSVYHPHTRCAWTALKHMVFFRDRRRRAIWMAYARDGVWSEPASILIPDDFDDVCAVARGFHLGDYYGMGMQPAGRGMAGFLWNYRQRAAEYAKHPGDPSHMGFFGNLDVTLVYRSGLNDHWQHPSGRQDFIALRDIPWGAQRITTSSVPVEVGDEHRLYFGTGHTSHDWQYGFSREEDLQAARDSLDRDGLRNKIGFASWPKWRLFGLRADPEGEFTLNVGSTGTQSRLHLNYACAAEGRVEVCRLDAAGKETGPMVCLDGDALDAAVEWPGEAALPKNEKTCKVRIRLLRATLWAWRVASA